MSKKPVQSTKFLENRSVKVGDVKLEDILFNPDNVKIHPQAQQEESEGFMDEIGWIGRVKINLRSSELWDPSQRGVETLLDGHMRCMIAARRGASTVPAEWYDLDPSEEAMALVLFDEIGKHSAIDPKKVEATLKKVGTVGEQTQKTMSQLAQQAGVFYQRQEDLDSKKTALDKVENPVYETIFNVRCEDEKTETELITFLEKHAGSIFWKRQ